MTRSFLGHLIVLLALGILPVALFAQDSPAGPRPTGELIDIGGYSLHVNVTGRGKPTVVLISGAGDFSFDWGLVQPQISSFSRCVSYDRAGLAWSDLGPTPRTMKQEAFELRSLLQKAGLKGPYVLVGHSIGGLIARTYAGLYPNDVAGMVLVDSTTEDTTLSYQGKIVRVRDSAKGATVPDVQTIRSSPPKPPTKADLEQMEFNRKLFGAPKITPPFDKLSSDLQILRLWALNNPKLSAKTDDYWPDELRAMHESRVREPFQLRNTPLVILVGARTDATPPGMSAELWKQLSDEKRKQKMELANLSRNSKLIIAQNSGHHIQLDEPAVVVDAIRHVVEAVRSGKRLPAN